MRLDTAYFTENWKHCNKIIFKCVNSVVRPIFNENFVEKNVCRSHEQYTEPTKKIIKKKSRRKCLNVECNPNGALVVNWNHLSLSFVTRVDF